MSAKRLALGIVVLALLLSPPRAQGQTVLSVSKEIPPDDLPVKVLQPALKAPVQAPRPAKPPSMLDRLKLPALVPGAGTPDIRMPLAGTPKEIAEAIQKYFPPLPPLGQEPQAQPGPAGRALILADLERLALGHSPVWRQAALEVEAARGVAVQAGLYPNPTVGYEGDTMAQARSAGLQGGFLEQ